MSRETKIGMAVAVSFLCLVGVVVVTKWRREPDGKKDIVFAGNPKESGAGKGVDNPPAPTPGKKNGIEPAEFKFPIEANPSVRLPGGNAEEPGSSNPPVAPALPVVTNPNGSPLPLPLPLPMPNSPELPPVPIVVTPTPPAATPFETEEARTKALLDKIKQQDVSLPPLTANPFDKAGDAKNKFGNVVDNSFNKGTQFANKGMDDVNNRLPKIDDGFNKPNNIANNTANTANNKINEFVNQGNSALNKGLDNINKPLTLPPPDNNPAFPPVPPTNGNTNSTAPGQPGLPPIETKAPALPTPKDFGLPPISNAATNNPMFVIPQPKANDARVVNYDVQSFQARAGDSFASLSRDVYKSEAYANALLAYNREFSSNRTMTALQPGQTVLFPPLQVLQQDRYAGAVADARPTIGAAPVSINPPVPLNPNRTFTPPTPSTDATKSHRIAAGGQKIYELAIQTLGDGSRWTEIYRLNPTIDPLQPIPGNTVVRLPGNANVP